MKNVKIPKTFMIYAKKGDLCGYLRFVCRPNGDTLDKSFIHVPHFVKSKKHSSIFVGFDNTRTVAVKCRDKYGFEDIAIVDTSTGKVNHVKNTKSQDRSKEIPDIREAP